MGDIAYWDAELSDKLGEISGLIGRAREADVGEKRKLLAQCDAKLRNVAATQRSFGMEMRLLDAESKPPYVKKAQNYESQVKQLKEEMKWIEREIQTDQRQELFGDHRALGGGDEMDLEDQVSRDDILQAAHETQNKTQASLHRTLATMNETNEIADATLEAMAAQTQQIKKIDDGLTDVASELDRAKDVMKSFVRRAMTDRLILVFLVLIIIAVIVLVIFVAIDKNKTPI